LPEPPKTAPMVLSLFTGAGGLDLGLETAGCIVIGSVESDPAARDSLVKNRPGWPHLPSHDVHLAAKLLPKDLGLEAGELDILAGAPPCQPFSAAAQWAVGGRKGMKDVRADTIGSMLDIVENFLPKVVFMENVTGFAQGQDAALPQIEHRLRLINHRKGTRYQLTWTILDSAPYGVPQHRRRALVAISREGTLFNFPQGEYVDNPITAWDAIGEIDPGPLPRPSGKWTELLQSIPEGYNYQWLTSHGGGSEIFGYRTRYWSFLLKLAKDQPSWTIPASPGPSTGPFHWDNRPLSVIELLRLQSFPLDWRLAGSQRDQVKLVGNATPPLLSEVIGKEIMNQLLGRQAMTNPPTLRIARSAQAAPPAILPKELSPKFSHLMGPKASHAGIGKGPAARQPFV
jgi:DNA (cytosine-5)-methyltransferase 1